MLLEFIRDLFGTCETCEHKRGCIYIEKGDGPCWQIYTSEYKREKRPERNKSEQ